MQSFDQIKSLIPLPNSYFFWFLQQRHAYNAQFGSSPLTIYQFDMELLLRDESLEKPLSTIYKALQPTNCAPGSGGSLCLLAGGLPELDSEDWEDIWDYSFSHLVSSRDRFIQFKILHIFHLMPYKIHKIHQDCSSCCWHLLAYDLVLLPFASLLVS